MQLVIELPGYVVDVEVEHRLGRPVSRARDEVEAVTASAGVVSRSHHQYACPERALGGVLDVDTGDEEPVSGHDGVQWRE